MNKLAIARMNVAACVARLMSHDANRANTFGETFRCVSGTLVTLSYSKLDHALTRNDLEDRLAEARDELSRLEAEERAADLADLATLANPMGDTESMSPAGRKAFAAFRAMGVA